VEQKVASVTVALDMINYLAAMARVSALRSKIVGLTVIKMLAANKIVSFNNKAMEQ